MWRLGRWKSEGAAAKEWRGSVLKRLIALEDEFGKHKSMQASFRRCKRCACLFVPSPYDLIVTYNWNAVFSSRPPVKGIDVDSWNREDTFDYCSNCYPFFLKRQEAVKNAVEGTDKPKRKR